MIKVLVGHQISDHGTPEIGPYNFWHADMNRLGSLLESWSAYDVSTDIESLAQSADSSREFTLLTVDDGFADFAENVLPLLERYRLNCIVFLTTGFIDSKLLPYELELARIIEAHEEIQTGKENFYGVITKKEKRRVYEKLRLEVKYKSSENRQAFLDSLIQLNETEKEVLAHNLFLTWKEIRELDRHPLVNFGAHTVTHPYLSAIPIHQAYREIVDSKRRIESELGHRINCFSYPYGGHSFIIRMLVRLAGFKYAFTTEDVIETGRNFKPLSIPRVDIKRILAQSKCNEK